MRIVDTQMGIPGVMVAKAYSLLCSVSLAHTELIKYAQEHASMQTQKKDRII